MKIVEKLPPTLKEHFEQLTQHLTTPEMLAMFERWLEPVKDQIPQDITPEESSALATAIWEEAMGRFQTFLKGVQTYQAHPVQREGAKDIKVIAQMGATRLLDYAPEAKGAVVFVVPSLVNRFDILDIEPDHSFLRYLAGQGLRPLVVDWGDVSEEEQSFDLSSYMSKRVLPLFDCALKESKEHACHVLGYCMGGVKALSLALMRESDIISLTLMATPWDFAVKGVAGVPSYQTWGGKVFAKQAALWEPYLEKTGRMPAFLLQGIFTTYQPLQILKKYMGFATLNAEDKKSHRFVLTEDWLNNGVALSWPVAKECLHAWFIENQTGEGTWSVAGQKVDPTKLMLPTYLLVPRRDRIVPPESALALQGLIPNTIVHKPDMGHIGVMASNAALENVWRPMIDWIKAQK